MKKQLLIAAFSAVSFLGTNVVKAQTWVQKSTGVGYSSYKIHFPTANQGYACVWNYDAGTSQILKTIDGANTFTTATNPLPNCYIGGVHFTSNNVGYAVGSFNQNLIAKTTDGGTSWTNTLLPSSGAAMQLQDVDFYDANNGIAVGYYGGVFTTNNAGATWTNREFNPTYIYEDVEYIDATHIWMVGNTYPVVDSTWAFFSSDGGVSWTKKMKFLHAGSDASNSISFPTVNDGWVVGYDNRILHTSDGGNNWAIQPTVVTTTATFNGVSFLNANDGWVTGVENSVHFILKTTDGGTTWTRTDLADDSYSKIQMISANKGYCSGGAGKFFKFQVNAAALNFDGNNDFINLNTSNNIPVGNSNYTIEAWIKPTSMGNYGIIGWGNYGTANEVNAFRLTNSGIVNYWWGNDLSINTGDLSGAWHHVAATYDGTTRKMYLDGNLIGSDVPAASSHNVPNTSNFAIGLTAPFLNEYFSGNMDEVRVWSTARSQCEIKSYMNCEIPSTSPNLVLNTHFNQGIVEDNNTLISTLTDVSGNANAGILTNFNLTTANSNWTAPGAVNSGYSIVANLTTSSDTTATACGNFTWYGNTYTNSGDQYRVLTNAAGCDSTITLHLTVNTSPQISAHSGNVHACGDVAADFGIIVNGSNNTYEWFYDLVGGSDFGNINGSFTEINYDTDTMTIQQLLTGNYNNYYVYCEVTNEFNCMSRSTNDTIWAYDLPVVTATASETTICAGTEVTFTGSGADSFVWTNGVTDGTPIAVTASNTYTVTGIDANNCENTATIDITANPMPSIATTLSTETITATETVTGVTYQWLDCNNSNAIIATETNQAYTAAANGNYAVELSLNGCVDTSACVAINTVSLKSITNTSGVSIYPNPAKENITVETEVNSTISVVNVIGQTVVEVTSTNRSTKIDTSNLISGAYFVKVKTNKGTTITKLIIE